MSLFKKLDLSQIKGRVLVIADVHGHFKALEDRLRELNYNPKEDRLVFLGDLIDRGPHSALAVEYLNHARVLGNHEQMFWNAVQSPPFRHADLVFLRNGGGWITNIVKQEWKPMAERLIDAPVALEILTPAGNRIGVVHAEVPYTHWDQVRTILSRMTRRDLETMQRFYMDETLAEHPRLLHLYGYLWGRQVICGEPTQRVHGIDHTFHGHTPVQQILTRGNATWCDGHAYAGGPMNVIDVDDFLRQLKK